jgi:hypothetical protein
MCGWCKNYWSKLLVRKHRRELAAYKKLLAAVQKILFREWDPIGINSDKDWPRDEYDSYAPAISRMLREGTDETRLAAHLGKISLSNMGLLPATEGDREAARSLLALVKQPDEPSTQY